MGSRSHRDLWTDSLVEDLNCVSRFLALRDVDAPTPEAIRRGLGGVPRISDSPPANCLLLLGCGLPYVAERAAEAMKSGVAAELLIAGGVGHSTEPLREAVRNHPALSDLETAGRPEAHIFRDIVARTAGIDAASIGIEDRSANCGENAEFAFRLLAEQRRRPPRTILLMQDPVLQRRADATFRRVRDETAGDLSEIRFLNFAPIVPVVERRGGALRFVAPPPGSPLWPMDRFIDLVLGEIPRLRDDERGYGPRGARFIVHVEIPVGVLEAHERLVGVLGTGDRGTLSPARA